MSPTVNPHWDVTDQHPATGTGATPKASSHNTGLPGAVPRGSPRPAALFGVMLAVAVGVYSTVGLPTSWTLPGQVSDATVLTISKTGFEPNLLQVVAGDSIAIRNSDTVAHTIELRAPIADSEALFSITLQPRRADMVEITDAMPVGSYMLTTTDAIPFVGQVVINTPPPNAIRSSSSSSLSRASTTITGNPVALPSSLSSTPTTGGTDDATPFVIEVNPYTVGSDFRPSAPPTPLNITASSSSATIVPLGTTNDTNYRPGAPSTPHSTPPSIPQSGPGLWMVGILTLTGFWLVTRRALRFE